MQADLRITELQMGPSGGGGVERKNSHRHAKRYETCQHEFFKSPHIVRGDRDHGHDERTQRK